MAMDGNDPENTRVIHNTPYPTDRGDNAANENAWAWGVLNRCGVALLGNNPIQGNTPFQHQDRATFSPLPTNPVSIEGVFIALLLFKIYRDKPQMFERLAIKYMDSVKNIIVSVADSGKTHPFNHLNSTTLAAAIAHRSGFLSDGGYVKVIDQTRSVIDKLLTAEYLTVAGNILGGIETLVEGSKVGGASGLGILANTRAAAQP